ncbi:MAG: hypothetical protein P9L93_00685 [Candidatus Gorgyraea atricola]|nr:hypothetical protein [Candidatus Gorgyraea atricola]
MYRTKINKVISIVTILIFFLTNFASAAPRSHLRAPMSFNKEMIAEQKDITEDTQSKTETMPVKMLKPVEVIDEKTGKKSIKYVVRRGQGKVVEAGKTIFSRLLKDYKIEVSDGASDSVKKVAAIHTEAGRTILSKYEKQGFVKEVLTEVKKARVSKNVEFVEDNDTLMDIAPASTDISDTQKKVTRFDLDLANRDVIDIEYGEDTNLTSKDPEILLGTLVLSALGQFHEWCHLSGMDQQLAIMKTFDLHDVMSQKEKNALYKVLDAGRIDGNNSFAMALKAQGNFGLAQEIEEEWNVESLLGIPSTVLHDVGVALSQQKAREFWNTIENSEGYETLKEALKSVFKDDGRRRYDNDKKEELLVNIERALKWKDQWALWLMGQELIDVAYDQQKVAELLRDTEDGDIDEKRRQIDAAITSSFDDDAEIGNIKRVSDKMREEDIMLVCGRVSRSFGNQMLLLSNSKKIKDLSPLRDITLKLEKAAKGVEELSPAVNRFRNLAFGVGKKKKVFLSQLKGAAWHMGRDLDDWVRERSEEINNEKEKEDQKHFGGRPDSYFENLTKKLYAKSIEIKKLLNEYEDTIKYADSKNSAYLILQQRFLPGETQRIAQLNYGQDAFPGKIEVLKDFFRKGSALRYATKGDATFTRPDGKKVTYSWLTKANHWIESIPLFIKERVIKETVIGPDGKEIEIEKTQTEVDQAGMEAFFRWVAEEAAKNCDEVMDSEHVTLGRELLVDELVKSDNKVGEKLEVLRKQFEKEKKKGLKSKRPSIARDLWNRLIIGGKVKTRLTRKQVEKISEEYGKEEAYRQIIIENALGERVAELGALIGKAYEDNIEDISLYKEQKSTPRINAVRDKVIKAGLVTADSELTSDLTEKAVALEEEAYKKRRPVTTVHILTTESAGMTGGFVQTWLESEMSMYNLIKGEGWEKEVEDKVDEYKQRLNALNMSVINDFGMWSEVEEAKVLNNLKKDDDAAAMGIVVSMNRPLAEEVAKLATLIEFYERRDKKVDLDNKEDPKEVDAYIKKNKKNLEETARGRVIDYNGSAIEDRVEILMEEGLSRKKAELKAIKENKDFKEDFDNFIRIEARAGLLLELHEENKDLALKEKAQEYLRNHTSLAKSIARREVIAKHRAWGLTSDVRYNYTASGAKKRYNLIYVPSRVDLGAEEMESIVRWFQWLSAKDEEAEIAGIEFYNQINEAGVVAKPWLEWQEIQKTAENASMEVGKAFAAMVSKTVRAVGVGDAQFMLYQMRLRRDKDRGAPPPSAGYAGYCVTKDGLFLAYVGGLLNERILTQMGIPKELHPLVKDIAKKLLRERSQFASEFEWETWAAKEILSEEKIDEFMRPYIEVRKKKVGLREEDILVMNLTKIAKVLGELGKPWEEVATADQIFENIGARMAQKVMIEDVEKIQRYMVTDKTSLIRRTLAKHGMRDGAIVVLTSEYKKVQDLRTSAGLRRKDQLAHIGDALVHQLLPEGQFLYYLDELGFTSLPKLETEKKKIQKLSGDEKKRKMRVLERRKMVSKAMYDDFKLVDGKDDEVIKKFEEDFKPAGHMADIRDVSSTRASTEDALHYHDDTRLEQIADQTAIRLAEYGLTEDQINTNAYVYGGELEKWAGIKDLPEKDRKKLLNSEIHYKIKGEPYSVSIKGAIHALVLKERGLYHSYMQAIQGSDVVDFDIDFPELLEIGYDYPKLIKLMLTGRPNSKLYVSDSGVGRINNSYTDEDIMMFFAACDNIAGPGKGIYTSIDKGWKVIEHLREENMMPKRQRSARILEALGKVADSDGDIGNIEEAQEIYYSIMDQIINRNEADQQMQDEITYKDYGRWRERDQFITEGLSRVNQGLGLDQLDFGTWLTMGGRYLVVGKSEEEIQKIREKFSKAINIISTRSSGTASNENVKVVNKQHENEIARALALPEFIPEAQKYKEKEMKEGSSKASEDAASEALKKRAAYRLKAIRFRAFGRREEGFEEVLKADEHKGKSFDHYIDEARGSLGALQSSMQELFDAKGRPEEQVEIRDRLNSHTGKFLAHAKLGLESIVNEIMPEGTDKEKEEKEKFLKNIKDLYTGREINIDIWRKIGGTYTDSKGDFGRLAEAAKGDKKKLEKIAEAGIELFYATFAIGQTIEFVQLERQNVEQDKLWHDLADFFGETIYDHMAPYLPYVLTKGEGYKDYTRDQLYALAVKKHKWLDDYFLSIYSNITDVADWSQEEKDAYFGNFKDGKEIVPVGNNAPTEAGRKWRSYGTKRQLAFNMSDGFHIPLVFPEFDPDIINADESIVVNMGFPPSRTHTATLIRKSAALNRQRLARGKRGAIIVANRYDEPQDVGGKKPVIMNKSGFICISKEQAVEALVKNKGYKRKDARKLVDKIEREDFIKSMMKNTRCKRRDAEKEAIRLQKKGVRISQGIMIAGRFTKPIKADNVIPYHQLELFEEGELQKLGLPATVQTLASFDASYDKALYKDIFEGSGVSTPAEIRWLEKYEKGKSEEEIIKLIIDGVPGTDYKGLKEFSKEFPDIVIKGSWESGARNLDTFTILKGGDLEKAAKFVYDVVHARSVLQNVVIQEALLWSPEVWASEGLLQMFVDRQIMEGNVSVKRESYPKDRIYATFRGIFSSPGPGQEYEMTHPILLMNLQVATNVGKGGTLECLLEEFIQPEYQKMILDDLKKKGILVNKAMTKYMEEKYPEIAEQKEGESDEVFALRKNTHLKDLRGVPYSWIPYLMNDFALKIEWETPGELVDVEPIYNEAGVRIGGRPILRDENGKRFEGKIKIIATEMRLFEPNTGIGLVPNFSQRQEAKEWRAALREGRDFNIDNVGIDDIRLLENIGVEPGEETRIANLGPSAFPPSSPGPRKTSPDKKLDVETKESTMLERAAEKARAALGMAKDQKFTIEQMSVLAKYWAIEQGQAIVDLNPEKFNIEDAIRNTSFIRLSKIVKAGLVKGLDLKNLNTNQNYYFTRIKDLAIEQAIGGERVAPELQIVPGKVKVKEAKKILGDLESFAIVHEGGRNFTNELYALIHDSLAQGVVSQGKQLRNVIGVDKHYLTEDGKARRIIIYSHITGELKEIELEEPIKIDRALTLYASKEAHREISEVLEKNDIDEVNPYKFAEKADSKSDCYRIWKRQAVISTPSTIIISQDTEKNSVTEKLNDGLTSILSEAKKRGLKEIPIVVQPDTGTETQGAKAFLIDVSSPDLTQAIAHIREIQNTDSVIVREYKGNIRYSEDGGETTYVCVFRYNVSSIARGHDYEVKSGYLQLAPTPDALITSIAKGGRIIGFSEEAFNKLYIDLGDGKPIRLMGMDNGHLVLRTGETMAKQSAMFLGLRFAGIDVTYDEAYRRESIDKSNMTGAEPFILDANPKPAGLTHTKATDPLYDGPLFNFWEKSSSSFEDLKNLQKSVKKPDDATPGSSYTLLDKVLVPLRDMGLIPEQGIGIDELLEQANNRREKKVAKSTLYSEIAGLRIAGIIKHKNGKISLAEAFKFITYDDIELMNAAAKKVNPKLIPKGLGQGALVRRLSAEDRLRLRSAVRKSIHEEVKRYNIFIDNAMDFAAGGRALNSVADLVKDIALEKTLSDEFLTHYCIDHLIERLKGLTSSDRDAAEEIIAKVLPEVAKEIIGQDLSTPIKSLFDLISDKEIKKNALVDFIYNLEDYTNSMPIDEYVFDNTSRAMAFIAKALDELRDMGASVTIGTDNADFCYAALKRFKDSTKKTHQDQRSLNLIADVHELKNQVLDSDGLEKLAARYEKIVPRLARLKRYYEFNKKYGAISAKPVHKALYGRRIRVKFPVGLSLSRCNQDNPGKHTKSIKSISYWLAAFNIMKNNKAESAGTVDVTRIEEKVLKLHAKSYDGAPVEIPLKGKLSYDEFFDMKDKPFRMIKASLKASGIIKEGSTNVIADILEFTNGGGLEISVDTIIPGGTGLGTSGAVATALCTALQQLQVGETPITIDKGSKIGELSEVLECYYLDLFSGPQDWRRPIGGESAFKIYTHRAGDGRSLYDEPDVKYLDVDVDKFNKHFIGFFPGSGFIRDSGDRLGAVLSQYLVRDRFGYQAMLDVNKVQDNFEDTQRTGNFKNVDLMLKAYQTSRNIMDPTTQEHLKRLLEKFEKDINKLGARFAFTGSPGGFMKVWCRNPKDKPLVVEYLNNLPNNNDPAFMHDGKNIFKKAQVFDLEFVNTGYEVEIEEAKKSPFDGPGAAPAEFNDKKLPAYTPTNFSALQKEAMNLMQEGRIGDAYEMTDDFIDAGLGDEIAKAEVLRTQIMEGVIVVAAASITNVSNFKKFVHEAVNVQKKAVVVIAMDEAKYNYVKGIEGINIKVQAGAWTNKYALKENQKIKLNNRQRVLMEIYNMRGVDLSVLDSRLNRKTTRAIVSGV